VQLPHISIYNLPAPSDPWTAAAAFAQIVSTLLTLFAVLFALWTIRHNKKTVQLQVLESVMHDIRDLAFKFDQEYKTKSEAEKKVWDSAFFNTVEYFSFLVNKKFLSDKRVLLFFADSIVVYYEQMYIVNYSAEHVNNPAKFSEFKTLYKKLAPKFRSRAATA
jgi:hypothetical protein